ncbi:hypothetical protein ACLI4Z_06335 [Natrialbaceae archaeon A-arb3/5]
MFRAILPEGQIVCERYDRIENGIELYDEDDAFIAFVPYANLHALIDEEVYGGNDRSIDERSIM